MAGSYNHAVDDKGRLRNWKTMGIATETQGDAYETIEEFYGMVWFLADGDPARVEEARQHYQRGIELSPGREGDEPKEPEDMDERGEWSADTWRIAQEFHETYEQCAEARGWATQERSRVPFDKLPPENRDAMLATVGSMLTRGVIKPGDNQFSYGSFDERIRPVMPLIELVARLQGLDIDNCVILLPPKMLEPFTAVYGVPLRRMEGITAPMLVVEGPEEE